jgi:hypothetical protein
MMLGRCLTGFAYSEPPRGYYSNFDGVLPKIYFLTIPIGGLLAYILVNKAFKHFDTVYVAPLFRVGDVYHSLLSVTIFLQELGEYNLSELLMFCTGILICIFGVLLLIHGNDQTEKTKQSVVGKFQESKGKYVRVFLVLMI